MLSAVATSPASSGVVARWSRSRATCCRGGHHHRQQQADEPARQGRLAGCVRRQPVARGDRLARGAADPPEQLGAKRRVGELRPVALGDEIADRRARRAILDQHDAHAVVASRRDKRRAIVGRDRPAIERAAGALPQRDRRGERAVEPFGAAKAQRDRAAWIDRDVGRMSGGRGCLHDRLGGAAEALEQMRIVRIDQRAAPRQVGRDLDRLVNNSEQPRLGVVARRRERAEPNERAQVERAVGWRPGDRALARRRGIVGRAHASGIGGSAVCGSSGVPRQPISKCRCGPVTRPVAPTAPMISPLATRCPTRTSMRERCM